MPQPPPKLILASRSPRRRELLAAAGYRFEVVVPSEEAECGVCSGEAPAELVARLARQKAADVAGRIAEGLGPIRESCDGQGVRPTVSFSERLLVLGCDTVAECDGQILGKPLDEDHARRMLQTLSGREHRVLSGLCLWPVPGGEPRVGVDVTVLRMDRLHPEQLDEYLASGQWEGKAGAFGYQDRLGWVHVVEGSPSNVAGLPMELLGEMLRAHSAGARAGKPPMPPDGY